MRGQDAALAVAAQQGADLLAQAFGIAADEPGAGLGDIIRRRASQYDRLPVIQCIGRRHGRRLVALGRQQLGPALGRQQRIVLANGGVGEAPPTVGQAEGDVDPALGAGAFHQHEQAARRHHGPHVAKRRRQVGRGVQHVDGQHDVEALAGEALLGRIALDVEQAVVGERVGGKPLAGAAEEGRRQIGEDVVGALRRQHGQDGCGGAARAGADLQHPQRPVAEPVDRRPHRGRHELVEDQGFRRFAIQPLGKLERSAGEQQRERIDRAGQHIRECGTAARREPQLRLGGRITVQQSPVARMQVARLRRRSQGPPCAIPAGEHAFLGQDVEQSRQQAAIAGQHAAGARDLLGGEGVAGFGLPAEAPQRVRDIGAAQCLDLGMEFLLCGEAVSLDRLGQRRADRLSEGGCRDRQGRGVRLPRRRRPCDLVQPVLDPLAACASRGEPAQGEAGDLGEQPAVVVEQPQPGAQRVGQRTRGNVENDVAPERGGRPAEPAEGLDAERQIGLGTRLLGQRRADHLQAGVQQHRVDAEGGQLAADGLGCLDAAQHLAVAPVNRRHGVHGRAEIEAVRPHPGMVLVRRPHLRTARPDRRHILARRRHAAARQPAVGMQLPAGFAVALAEDLEARIPGILEVDHGLDGADGAVGEIERLADHHVLDRDAFAAEMLGCGGKRHFEEARGRHDRPALARGGRR